MSGSENKGGYICNKTKFILNLLQPLVFHACTAIASPCKEVGGYILNAFPLSEPLEMNSGRFAPGDQKVSEMRRSNG